jgi:hypothetical protein
MDERCRLEIELHNLTAYWICFDVSYSTLKVDLARKQKQSQSDEKNLAEFVHSQLASLLTVERVLILPNCLCVISDKLSVNIIYLIVRGVVHVRSEVIKKPSDAHFVWHALVERRCLCCPCLY